LATTMSLVLRVLLARVCFLFGYWWLAARVV
jgi:hypothetical protein